MILIGLTGGIASGKSTVARLLEKKGALIVDADKIGHEVIAEDGPAYEEVVLRFGTEILSPDGSIDRTKLGQIVFRDDQARRDLEAISHPEIYKEIVRRIEKGRETYVLVVLDAPLLVETMGDRGRSLGLDALVVVAAGVEEQVERLARDRSMARQEADTRIAAQASGGRKMAAADYIVDNRATLSDLNRNVDKLWSDLMARFEVEV